MKTRAWLLAALLAAALPIRAQQPSPASAPAPAQTPKPLPTAAHAALLQIWQIDLDPSGTAFSFGQPVLEGDAYVFQAWPDHQTVHLSKTKVKKVTQRTKDLEKEAVYVIELVPTGRMIAREDPKLKNGQTYVFHTWRDGTLMSLRKGDVKSITKATGIAAFRIQQEERGASLNANLPMEGGSATIINAPPAQPAAGAPADSSDPGNWRYEGQPGTSDAYAPPSAVVASPGDVPKAAPTAVPPH